MSISIALLVTILLAGSSAAGAERTKRALEHADVDRWQAIQEDRISARGGWVTYRLVSAGDDEARLVVQSVSDKTRYTINRGAGARVDLEDEWLLCRIEPDSTQASDRTDLGVLRLADGHLTVVESVASFALPTGAGGLTAWLHDTVADTAQQAEADSDTDEVVKKDGAQLVLHNLVRGTRRYFDAVLDYTFSPDGHWLVLVRGGEEPGLCLVPTAGGDEVWLLTGEARYEHFTFDKGGHLLAFLSDHDSENHESENHVFGDHGADDPAAAWSVYLWSDEEQMLRRLVEPGAAQLTPNWHVSADRALRFSETGRRLFFGTAPDEVVATAASDSGAEDVVLDVWSWTDEVIQTRQLVGLEAEQKRSYLAVVPTQMPQASLPGVVQLGDEAIPSVHMPSDGESSTVLGVSNLSYRRSYGWDQQVPSDLYLIDPETGQREQILTARHGSFRLSPGGQYVWWWDGAERAWFAMDVDGGVPIDLSAAIGQRVDNERHDRPALPGAYGAGGWLQEDAGLIIYDRYDLWLVDPGKPDAPKCLTAGAGREQGRRFRLIDLDRSVQALDPAQALLLSSLHLESKEAGFHELRFDRDRAPKELLRQASHFSRPVKADSAATLLMRIGRFDTFDDLWVTDGRLKHLRQLSHANPQQADYRWGSAELVQWQSMDGTPLQGILYKPEDFDPARQYPMITYFYERNSDHLHAHHPPTPHRSIIRFPFYTSRGYLVFVPDIEYKEGAPGPSAVASIVPGVLKLIGQGFVDADAIGLQGHSWGGYQAAFLITQTDLFACAVAGAVVSNMTSAYGGIRWATGVSRMYKYEKGQSRIGGTLWEETHRYIDNSPLFFADQVATPLLMMHNDQDGAVPWYQGIEYFLALRRLGQPVWLLNYNGQPHWVTTKATQADYATRMQQFFDHYLRGASAPRWMAEGIPATQKGQTLGLDLIE